MPSRNPDRAAIPRMTGSTRMAASSDRWARAMSRAVATSSYGAVSTFRASDATVPGVSRVGSGAGAQVAVLPKLVLKSVASFPPWNAPSNFRMRSRPELARTARSAIVQASVPELNSRTFSALGTISQIRAASSIAGGFQVAVVRPALELADDGRDDLRVRMADQDTARAEDEVEQALPVRRPGVGALGAFDDEFRCIERGPEPRGPGAERPDSPTGQMAPGEVEEAVRVRARRRVLHGRAGRRHWLHDRPAPR